MKSSISIFTLLLGICIGILIGPGGYLEAYYNLSTETVGKLVVVAMITFFGIALFFRR